MPVLPRAQLEALIRRVSSGLSPAELVFAPHENWPCTPGTCLSQQLQQSHRETEHSPVVQISILDASFNPPTLAHLALASLPALAPSSPRDTAALRDFDARMLLLSVRNADKSPKPSDATYAQRLEMMIHLSKEVQPVQPERPQVFASDRSLLDDGTASNSNVAVVIIDEPTFVGKARILNSFLRERIASVASASQTLSPARPQDLPVPELTFIVGIDTLERILATRYYPSPEEMRLYLKQFMASAKLLCSRRIIPGALSEAPVDREKEVLALAQDYLDIAKLAVVDIDEEVEAYSSSEVRQRIGDGDASFWARMVPASIAEYIIRENLYLANTSTSP